MRATARLPTCPAPGTVSRCPYGGGWLARIPLGSMIPSRPRQLSSSEISNGVPNGVGFAPPRPTIVSPAIFTFFMWRFTPSPARTPTSEGGSQFPGTARALIVIRRNKSSTYDAGLPKCVMSPHARRRSGACSRIAAGITSRAAREPWRSVAIRIRTRSTSEETERPEDAERDEERHEVPRDRPPVEKREARLWIPFHHEPHQDREPDEDAHQRHDRDEQICGDPQHDHCRVPELGP